MKNFTNGLLSGGAMAVGLAMFKVYDDAVLLLLACVFTAVLAFASTTDDEVKP